MAPTQTQFIKWLLCDKGFGCITILPNSLYDPADKKLEDPFYGPER